MADALLPANQVGCNGAILRLFKSSVRPQLEHCIQVGMRHGKANKVKRRATK